MDFTKKKKTVLLIFFGLAVIIIWNFAFKNYNQNSNPTLQQIDLNKENSRVEKNLPAIKPLNNSKISKVGKDLKEKEPTSKQSFISKIKNFINSIKPKKEEIPTSLKLIQDQTQDKSKTNKIERVVVPANTCFTIMYKHSVVLGHSNLDDCSNHKNLIKFKPNNSHPNILKKSICLKVDGIIVKFQQKDNDFMIGPGAGPESIISLRYCPSFLIAANECKLPTDSFVSALGTELGDLDSNSELKWDESSSEEKVVTNVDEELGSELNPNKIDSQGLTIFDGWTELSTKTEKISIKGN